ncbi:MAG: UvrB/UvrC motif-containing protein [Verrucomicrobiales bacterium]|jgi:protein arginine kinase activator|nr:UvrB/UvrC motif-containing protein [Verrucomicrobiales bacterium]
MICEKCHASEATVFLTQIVEGEMRKVDLCEKCAREMGVNQSAGFSLTDLLLKGSTFQAKTKVKSCPVCGFSEQELRKTGRLGCPKCYEVFTDIVKEALHDAQRASHHTGKIPHNLQKQIETESQRQDLEQALAEAIHSENYEQAAQLRDQLKSL